jgi:urease accessory protein
MRVLTIAIRFAFAAILLGLAIAPGLAHSGSASGGFIGGFAHPLFGPDHVVAMVAVGLWGAFLGAPAIWLLPIVFPLVMAAGARLASSASRCRRSRPGSPPLPLCSA